MNSVAASSLGVSASVIRPISPCLKAPALAHSTTSPIAWFFLVATRRAVPRNSLRSWLNPERPCDPFPLLRTGCEPVPLAGDFQIRSRDSRQSHFEGTVAAARH